MTLASTRPTTTAFYETAPVQFRVTRTIAATPDEVFAALADTPAWPQWFGAISRAEWLSDAPHGLASKRRVKVGPVWINEEFIVWEPGRRWGFSITSTTVPVVRSGAELVELEQDGDGTRVTYGMYLEPFGGLGPVVKAAGAGVRRGLAEGLKGLDRHLAGPA